MSCDAALILPISAYAGKIVIIEDNSPGLPFDVYALTISGPDDSPSQSVSFAINGSNGIVAGQGNPSIEGAGSVHPKFKVTILLAGIYSYAYTVNRNEDCSNTVTGKFSVTLEPDPPKCTDGFIKFKSVRCKNEPFIPSTSRLYFENLEGISVKSIADVTTSKYKNIEDMVNSRLDHAINTTMEKLIGMMPDNDFRNAVRTYRFGHFSKIYLPAVNKERGIRIRKQYTPLSYFLFEWITVRSNTTINGAVIKIFDSADFVTRTNEKEYIVDLVAGQDVRVKVDHRSDFHQVFVVIDNSNISMNESFLYYGTGYGFDGDGFGDNYDGEMGVNGCDGCGDDMRPGDEYQFSAYGYDFLHAVGWDGLQRSSQTFGIKVDYSIRCDKEILFCKLMHENKMAILYATGAEILKEWLAGDRLTFLKIYGEEWAQSKVVEWAQMSQDYLQNSLEGMSRYMTNLDVLCLPCNGNRLVNIIP